MAKTLITFPGKIGDALAQWPCAYWWSKEHNEKFDVMLDESISGLKDLLEIQECVDEVHVVKRIEHWRCGGQPWDMNLSQQEVEYWPTIFHMGLRTLPTKQLTLMAKDNIPIKATESQLSEQSLFVGPRETDRMLVVHATTKCHYDPNVRPRVWDVLGVCGRRLRAMFYPIILIGNDDDWALAREYRWDGMQFLNTDLLATAKLINNASFVLGSGSMGVVLAATLGIPTLRVHDPLWGQEDFTFWSNLGTQHANYYPEGAIRPDDVMNFVENQCLRASEVKSTV